VGSIAWNTTTGAVTSGTGFAITEKGIIGAQAGATKLAILTDGTATFGGTLSAAGGTLGTITGGTIDIGTGGTSWHVDSSGNMWSGNAAFGSAPFRVSNTGALTASSGTFSGSLTGASGTITGATLQTSAAASANRVVLDSGGFRVFDTAGSTAIVSMGGYSTVSSVSIINAGANSGLSVSGTASGAMVVGANSGTGTAVRGASTSGVGVLGECSTNGMGGDFNYAGGTRTVLSGMHSGSVRGVHTQGTIVSTLATGTAPIDVTSTTLCPNLRAASLGNAGNSYTFEGGSQAGSATVAFPGNNKPGPTSGLSNGWVKLTIDSTVLWIPAWGN
jgi:hypothetical protein